MSDFSPGPIFGWPQREVIHRDGSPYLTRWWLIDTERHGRLYLHRFHRSDDDVLHDHPWDFWSLILRGGYWEWTPFEARLTETLGLAGGGAAVPRWYRPGSLLRRPAEWRHRVEIPEHLRGKVWTLVWTGPKVRDWGFWCPKGFIGYAKHVARRARGLEGCP